MYFSEHWKENIWITKMGDFARYAALEFIKPKSGEIILDAGCGTGFIAQKLARSGAKIFGCDKSHNMLNEALEQETLDPLRIQYCHSDISSLPYSTEFFDAVACVAVLMNCTHEEVRAFIQEGYRVLKPSGRLIISITHPDLYLIQKNRPQDWLSFNSLGQNQFQEIYYNNQRKLLCDGTTWCHSEEFLLTIIQRVGFEIAQTQTIWITQKRLAELEQTGKSGPGYFQILAYK